MIGLASIMIVILIVSLSGCTDVNQTNAPPTDYRSNVMFVNLSHVGSGMSISFDTTHSLGTVAYAQKSTYQNLPAGSRYFIFNYGAAADTLNRGFDADNQYTFFSVFEPANGDVSRHYELVGQGYTWASAGVKDSALVRFVNMSSDTISDFSSGLSFTLGPASLNLVATGVQFGGSTSYMKVAAGNSSYMVVVEATGDTLIPSAQLSALQSYGRYSVVIYGNNTSIQTLVVQEH